MPADSVVSAAAGIGRPGGPTPRLSLRTSLSTLLAKSAIYPSQPTFHKPRKRVRAQLPAAKFLPVRVRTVSFLGSHIPGIIHRQGDVPTFLLWWKEDFPARAGLTVFVTRTYRWVRLRLWKLPRRRILP